MTGEREDAPEGAAPLEGAPGPNEDSKSKPGGLDPQIKAIIEEMRRVDFEHKGGRKRGDDG